MIFAFVIIYLTNTHISSAFLKIIKKLACKLIFEGVYYNIIINEVFLCYL
jgi:hypothetical protein